MGVAIGRKWVAALVALGAMTVPLARADQGLEWENRRQEQRKSYEALMENVPQLDPTRPGDVMRIRVEDKILVLRTSLPSTQNEGYLRVKLDGTHDFALLRVQGGSNDRKVSVVPSNFQFTLNDYSQPHQISTLSVTAEQTYLTVSRSVQLPEGYSSVQLIERVGSPGYGQSGAVQLVVSENGSGSESPVSLDVEAPDFFTLAQAYPLETAHYLRPLLRDLGQEPAFAPDPLVAWQVFADEWKADEAAARRVAELMPTLNVDDFHVRENAMRELQKLGRQGAAVLMHLDRRSLSPEQNVRVDRVLADYAQLAPKEAQRLHNDAGFLLDCLYCEEPALRQAAIARLRQSSGDVADVRIEGGADARVAQIAALRRKLETSPPQESTLRVAQGAPSASE